MIKEKEIRKRPSHEGSAYIFTKKELYNFMFDYDKQLEVYDLVDIIELEHNDGSYFKLPCAYIYQDNSKIYIYTEHCGFFYFYKESVKEIKVNGIKD